MNKIKYYLAGLMFGVIMTKAEVISWYRIYEMFKFQSFHMFGIIGSAVVLGGLMVFWIKKTGFKSKDGMPIHFMPKKMSVPRYLIGGIIFGLGWAMTGACPGPMFTLVGNGFVAMLVVVFSAVLGTFVYGIVKDRLPH